MSIIYRHRTEECTAPIRLIAPPFLNRQRKLYRNPAAPLSLAFVNRGSATNSRRGKDYYYYIIETQKWSWNRCLFNSSQHWTDSYITGGFLPHLAIPRFSYPTRWWIYLQHITGITSNTNKLRLCTYCNVPLSTTSLFLVKIRINSSFLSNKI